MHNKEICKLYLLHKSLRKVSRITGYSKEYIRKILTLENITVKYHRYEITPEDVANVRELHKENKSMREIARELNKRLWIVNKIFVMEKLTKRPVGDRFGVLFLQRKETHKLNAFEEMIYN